MASGHKKADILPKVLEEREKRKEARVAAGQKTWREYKKSHQMFWKKEIINTEKMLPDTADLEAKTCWAEKGKGLDRSRV